MNKRGQNKSTMEVEALQADSGGGTTHKQDGDEFKILQRLVWEKREGVK